MQARVDGVDYDNYLDEVGDPYEPSYSPTERRTPAIRDFGKGGFVHTYHSPDPATIPPAVPERSEAVDLINHPPHYQNSKGTECIDLIWDLNFPRGSAVKYIVRAGKKDASKELEDLRKARWFLDFEIARLENE